MQVKFLPETFAEVGDVVETYLVANHRYMAITRLLPMRRSRRREGIEMA
jgi:hypothetical protein